MNWQRLERVGKRAVIAICVVVALALWVLLCVLLFWMAVGPGG